MTYEGALYWYTHKGATIEQEKECEILIKEALEKQIPKKVTLVLKNDYDLVYCPRCGVRFIQYGKPFCGECGQALDWSERNA